MSINTSTAESANRTATVPEWDDIPCVQYGFPDEVGPIRSPKLQTVFEPIPEGVITASPIYNVPREKYERQERFESGYEVKGSTSIATELQDGCEANDSVLYPVHIESDVYPEEGPATLIGWFREFVEDYLDVPFHTCWLYYSGNRSIHVHVPRFVAGERTRERLKELAESFCEETGAELDCGLYYAKRMFRLPGVEHKKTGLRKVKIEPEWEHKRIVREASNTTPTVPGSYEAVLRRVFATQPSLIVDTPQTTLEPPYDLFQILDSEKTVLEFPSKESEIETLLIEQAEYPDNPSDVPEWAMYNTKEFSPYASASGNPRSVAALRVKRGPFARKGKRNGATMVPAYFYGAKGCNGEFTKKDMHAPLQLSKPDYRKWDYEPGDSVVIIGGKSGSSRLLNVSEGEARVVGHALTGEDASRETALDYLSDQGYEVGASGSKGLTTSRGGTSPDEARSIWPARQNPQTEAEELQRQAEQEGIETLTHNERIRIACRHLRQGWRPTWDWFKDQYGPEFDSEITRSFLREIVESGDFEEYDHIEVPE